MANGLLVRYYLYRLTISVGFVSPIFSLFVLRSLTYPEFGLLSSIFAVLVVAGEVPTGYVADRFGRRASMLCSVCCSTASIAGFVVADSFPAFAVLYVLWGFAWAFRSGSADAWLYETLRERLDEGEFSRIRGRGGAVTHWTSVVTMICGGLLYGLDPRAPFVAAAALNALGVVTVLSLPATDSGNGDDRTTVRDATSIVVRRFSEPPLRSFVAFVALFFGAVGAADAYVQPMAIEFVGSDADAAAGQAGASAALGLGLLYAGFTAIAAVASDRAGRLEDALGPRRAVVAVALVTGVVLLLPPLVPLLVLPAFVAMRGSNAVLTPVVNHYLNDRVDSSARATVLSAASMLYAVVRAPMAFGAGVVADLSTATVAVAALGAAFLCCGALVLAFGTVRGTPASTLERAD